MEDNKVVIIDTKNDTLIEIKEFATAEDAFEYYMAKIDEIKTAAKTGAHYYVGRHRWGAIMSFELIDN